MSILEVQNLTVEFRQRSGPRFRAVDDVSFALVEGETLALVGESGSGKSTIARTLARLQRPTQGQILIDGAPAGRRGRDLRAYRKAVQMVFQDPFASLNPAFSVNHHLKRPLLIHGCPRGELDAKVEELLESVNLVPAATLAKKLPHELSGGQRQRVAIARALAPEPKVILADEPISMLDVSIRLEIMNLLDRLKRDRSLAMLYITHDLATARHFSSNVLVMYRGEIVESGPTDKVILSPAHPYTRLLANSVASTTRRSAEAGPEKQREALKRAERVATTGCRFRHRCPSATDACLERPVTTEVSEGHHAKCWLYCDKTGAGTSS